MSEFFGSVWWMLVTLGLLITFHEFGHFWVARRLGTTVLRFSVGFGKALWSRRDRHGTEYVIAAIPLGGYVKFLDERELDEAASPADLQGAFNRQSVWTRIAITAAGPVANLIFAVAAFWVMFIIGRPDYQPIIGRAEGLAATAGFVANERIVSVDGEPLDNWSDVNMALLRGALDRKPLSVAVVDGSGSERVHTLPLDRLPKDGSDEMFKAIGLLPKQLLREPVVGQFSPDSAAKAAGLAVGDRIVSIDDIAIADGEAVTQVVKARAAEGKPLQVRVQRGDDAVALAIVPRLQEDERGEKRFLLGIGFKPSQAKKDALLRYGPLRAIPEALKATRDGVRDSLVFIGKMVTGAASSKNLSGVVGIAQVANASASQGAAWFLNFLALISISLAVLNLLPIPVLDGGHLLYYLVELIRGKPVSERVQIAAQYAGLFLIVALMSLALYNDVFHLTGRG